MTPVEFFDDYIGNRLDTAARALRDVIGWGIIAIMFPAWAPLWVIGLVIDSGTGSKNLDLFASQIGRVCPWRCVGL